jgi:hypothetical protein
MSMPAGANGGRAVPLEGKIWRTASYLYLLDFQSKGGTIMSITSDPIQDRMGR